MTLLSYVRTIRARWRALALIVLCTVSMGALVTLVSPRLYQADAQVFVSSSSDTSSTSALAGVSYAQAQVSTYAAIIDSPDVLTTVIKNLELPYGSDELKTKITANTPAAQTLVNIHVVDASPSVAAAIANATSTAFIDVIQRYSTPAGSSTPSVRLFVTDPAVVPVSPVSPDVFTNIGLALALGLIVGVAFVVIRDVLDNRIRDLDDLSKTTGLSAMGRIVEDRKASEHVVAARSRTGSARAENYRQLRANLQFANVDDQPKVLAVSSSMPGEGKTTIAVNLATSLADAGLRVCLVDADLRRPAIATKLGLVAGVGLTSVLTKRVALRDALQPVGPNLTVLTSGPVPPNPSEILASSYVRDLVARLSEDVDFVIIDTAPLLPVVDGAEVAAFADGTLLVARHGSTTYPQLRRAVQSLLAVDATILGVALNRVPERSQKNQYYAYYEQEADVSTPPPPPEPPPVSPTPAPRVHSGRPAEPRLRSSTPS